MRHDEPRAAAGRLTLSCLTLLCLAAAVPPAVLAAAGGPVDGRVDGRADWAPVATTAAALPEPEPPPPPPPPSPPRCSYQDDWFPYWSGQDDLPQATLRVLANGEEIVNKGFCINELWVWLGSLREDLKVYLENQVIGQQKCTPVGEYTIFDATVSQTPFESLLFSMEFRDGGDLELLALTHNFEASIEAGGEIEVDLPPTADSEDPCHATCSCFDSHIGFAGGEIGLDMPTLFSDGVLRGFFIDDWALEWPRASFDTSDLGIVFDNTSVACQFARSLGFHCSFLSQLVTAIAHGLGGGIAENVAFDLIRGKLESRLDPNDALRSLLGFDPTILQALVEAGQAIGIDVPSPPCGTRFTIYLENPPSNRTSGGKVTIALFAPL